MKKILTVLLIVSMALSFGLTGCSDDDENTDVQPIAEDNDQVKEEEEEEENKEQGSIVISPEVIDQKVAELEELYPDIEVDIEVIKNLATDIEEYKTIDVEPVPDRNANILKYKVSELDAEYIDDSSGTYVLSYFSDAEINDVVVYFHMLLSGTQDFGIGSIDEGEYIAIGHLKGMKVDVHISDEGDETNVGINCFE